MRQILPGLIPFPFGCKKDAWFTIYCPMRLYALSVGTDTPCFHLEIVCLTTFKLIASSFCGKQRILILQCPGFARLLQQTLKFGRQFAQLVVQVKRNFRSRCNL